MAVVISGQSGVWLNLYNKVQGSLEVATADLQYATARESDERGNYSKDEHTASTAGPLPVLVKADRRDPINPQYTIVDKNFQAISGYSVDGSGHIRYQPTAAAAGLGASTYNSPTGGGTITLAANSYVWHPDVPGSTATVPAANVNLGRAFTLSTVQPAPNSTSLGGRIYVKVNNNARVYINGTFVGAVPSGGATTEIPVPAAVLKAGENILTLQCASSGTAWSGPGAVSVHADLGGINGLGATFGGVSLTTAPNEQPLWSISRRGVNGYAGQIDFQARQGGALEDRRNNISQIEAVLQTLSGLMAATADVDKQMFQKIR